MLTWFAISIQKHVLLFVSYQVHKHSYYCSDESEFNQLSPVSHYIDEGGSATATIQQNVSFTELMETPKIKKKGVCRKKSLNHKAQLVIKKLFYGSKKVTFKKQSKNVLPKKKQKAVPKKKKSTPMTTNSASWFCAACGKDTALSMRQCHLCKIWYHDECVGLDSDDEDNFFCMECN